MGGTETILLAEDNEGVLGVAKAMLEVQGTRFGTAVDGEDALRVFDAYADEIALVLCDVMMPKLSGKAVYEKIIQKAAPYSVSFCERLQHERHPNELLCLMMV